MHWNRERMQVLTRAMLLEWRKALLLEVPRTRMIFTPLRHALSLGHVCPCRFRRRAMPATR
eukprot:10841355-Lingulodinium_polyedra.AAC.1